MIRVAHLLIGLAGIGSAALAAPVAPSVLDKVSPGLWELGGIAGSHTPVRTCIGDLMLLSRIEHRQSNCAQQVLRSDGASLTVAYTCSPKNFGRSRIDLITPRSLRIDTQGIADDLPFAYVVQARRIGDCGSVRPSTRH
jgi:hypothetical protein